MLEFLGTNCKGVGDKETSIHRIPWTPTLTVHCACAGLPRHCCGHAGASGDHQFSHPGQHSPVHQDSPTSHAQIVQAAQIWLRLPRYCAVRRAGDEIKECCNGVCYCRTCMVYYVWRSDHSATQIELLPLLLHLETCPFVSNSLSRSVTDGTCCCRICKVFDVWRADPLATQIELAGQGQQKHWK